MTPSSTNGRPVRKTGNLRRFFHYVGPYRTQVVYATLAGIVRYLIPLVLPWALKVLVDDFMKPAGRQPYLELNTFMAGVLCLYGVYAVASYFRSYLGGLAGHSMILDLRRDLYLHLQRMSLSFFDRRKVGEVVSRMTHDIASAQNFVGSAMVNTAMDLACVGVILALLFMAHWKLALVSLAVLPFYALMNQVMSRRIRAKSRNIHDQLQDMSGDLHEQFAAISTVQSFTREEEEAGAFQQKSSEFLDLTLSNVRMQSLALAFTGFLTALGPILVLWFGVTEVWQDRLSLGSLMAFYAYLGLLYQPIQRLTELNLVLAASLAAMDRIYEIFDSYPEVRESADAVGLGPVVGRIGHSRPDAQIASAIDRVCGPGAHTFKRDGPREPLVRKARCLRGRGS